MEIRELEASDRPWSDALFAECFGSTRIVSRGDVHEASTLPGLVAHDGDTPVGVLCYRIDGPQCEVVALVVERPRQGIGRALTNRLRVAAREAHCTRLWLVTTNDNVGAQSFYQALGWRLAAIHCGAVTRSRELKPEIPFVGSGGVPIEDEIEFDLELLNV
jgi:GNAT superfamily N-acetyltransferase